MRFIKNNIFLIAVLILCFWALKPLFHSGFFTMHDNEQVARLFDLNQALATWHIPPRIAPNLGFGYGYPFFNFYPPFVYYIAEIFKFIGFSYISSIKLMVGLGIVLGAFFMYLLSKEFFGKLGGLISAVFYTYAPYHAVDIYVRGAFPEFWSMLFLPAIFWSLLKYRKKSNWKYFVFSVFSISALILTHNLIMIMAIPFIAIWIIYLFFNGIDRKKFIINISVIFALSFFATSYFWMPSFFERKFTMVDLLTTELANYGQHFVCPIQLWSSAWGFGGSVAGCIDGMSFQIGKAHIVLSLLAIIISIIFLFSNKNKNKGIILAIFLFGLAFSAFMTTSYSQFIWDSFNFLWYIQFPWRFIIFTSFFSSLLAGSITLLPIPRKLNYIIACIILLLVIGKSVKYFAPSQHLFSVKDSDYANVEKIRWDISKLAWEYVPKGIRTVTSSIGTTVIDIRKDEIARNSYQVISGDMNVKETKNLLYEKKYIVNSKQESILRVNTYDFPGWKIFVDNKNVSYSTDNKLKLITLNPLVGSHTIEVKFTNTPVRFWGNMISSVTIISLIIFCISNMIKTQGIKQYEKNKR